MASVYSSSNSLKHGLCPRTILQNMQAGSVFIASSPNLIQAHDIIPPVIELGCPRALVGCHLLRLLEVPAIATGACNAHIHSWTRKLRLVPLTNIYRNRKGTAMSVPL